MRKLLISLLLASAAASPALAGPRDHSDRDSTRAERKEAREAARSESHADRAVQNVRPQLSGGNHVNVSNSGGQPPLALRQHGQPNGGPDPRQVEAFQAAHNDAPDRSRNWRGSRHRDNEQNGEVVHDRRDRFDNDALRHSDRRTPDVMRTRVPVVSSVPRPHTQPPLRLENRRRDNVRWNTDWRRDNRYDWRRWRDRHRSHFHLGFYYDPFGWGYQPYSVGWRLWPNYYSSSFWINDPWQYRLPYAPPGTRWIRYYNDALLVDTFTGEVVDAIYNFFW
jgi:nickel/cobalt transporter regulator